MSISTFVASVRYGTCIERSLSGGICANPNGAAALRRTGKGGAPLREAVSRNADRHAEGLAPVLADIREEGHTSLRAIAAELNARGMLTRRGGQWQVSNVGNLIRQLKDKG
ncbi:hypothetical protein FGG78_22665 [Thioclava sp. BHET1]|nr:hypothetical protein FGG78_22665 [Thioclava sp. BHET1]